jgi:hypothetical protein
MNVNHIEQDAYKLYTPLLRTDRRASGNSGFKKLAVQWLYEHSTSHQHLWWLDSFVLRNRQLLKPANRQDVKKLYTANEMVGYLSEKKLYMRF